MTYFQTFYADRTTKTMLDACISWRLCTVYIVSEWETLSEIFIDSHSHQDV